jgi:hypothetical protein
LAALLTNPFYRQQAQWLQREVRCADRENSAASQIDRMVKR